MHFRLGILPLSSLSIFVTNLCSLTTMDKTVALVTAAY